MYAEIGFQRKVGERDTLTYQVPREATPGSLVKVPLRNQKTHGIVLKTSEEKPSYPTKEVEEIAATNLLTPWQLQLIFWISEYYMAPLNKVIKLFVPAKIFNDKNLRPRKTEEKEITKIPSLTLTKDQKEAFDKIHKSKKSLFLLHGITGSGKTEIYVQLAKKYIAQKKQVLILVPEISLTPQTVEYFEKSIGEKASVIHSRLAEGERIKAWKNIKEGETKIIIGSRSSVFAPFKNLGLIVIDEEHETSYKQEQSPRYNTKDIALKMVELIPDLKVVFGSATPLAETFANKKIEQVTLKERFNKTPLPKVRIADMRDELKKKNFSIFSDTLYKKIEQALKKKEQIILFLNRRGKASAIACRACGYRVTCPDCDISLTYHRQPKPILICHHCGIIKDPPVNCPECKSHYIKHLGIGTQKVEEEVLKAFPGVRVLRADKDTTTKKHDFEKIYKDFRNHKADILVGTQMIGKGLHLPKVSLVGVVLADIGLGIPDFKSQERTFQLLTQVAGRAGRGKDQGEVVIQTYDPENLAIQAAKEHDYKKFYTQEILNRENCNYPPFSKMIKLIYSNPTEQKCIEETASLAEKIGANTTTYPALITKKGGKYHYNILIKAENPREKLKEIEIPDGWKIDVDPISIN
jgi:primosomal protein N' (replication factor Y) (superfamily II helicase)